MSETKRERVADELRMFVTAQLRPGDKLPAIPTLTERYGTSVNTIRAALSLLSNEGLIRTEHGTGSYVLPVQQSSRQQEPVASEPIYRYASRSDIPIGGAERVYIDFADDAMAGAFGISASDDVLVREYVVKHDERPVQLVRLHLPRTITKGTAIEVRGTEAYDVLEQLKSAGHIIAGHTEHVTLRRANASEAAQLQVVPGAACFHITRTTNSDTDRVLMVSTMILLERYRLVYELPAEGG